MKCRCLLGCITFLAVCLFDRVQVVWALWEYVKKGQISSVCLKMITGLAKSCSYLPILPMATTEMSWLIYSWLSSSCRILPVWLFIFKKSIYHRQTDTHTGQYAGTLLLQKQSLKIFIVKIYIYLSNTVVVGSKPDMRSIEIKIVYLNTLDCIAECEFPY